MAQDSHNKIRVLKLWEILKNESDEDRPLSTVQILDKLKVNGIECDRRTLYSDIDLLNANGYEVICHHGQHSNIVLSSAVLTSRSCIFSWTRCKQQASLQRKSLLS